VRNDDVRGTNQLQVSWSTSRTKINCVNLWVREVRALDGSPLLLDVPGIFFGFSLNIDAFSMLNSAYKHRNNRKQARVKTVCYKLGEREKGPRIYNVTKNSTADYIFISCFCSQLCKTITINTCFRPTMKDQIVYVNQMWMLSLNEERHGTNDLTHRAQGRFAQPGDRTSMKIPLRLHARS
jgi:hypothetical protein